MTALSASSPDLCAFMAIVPVVYFVNLDDWNARPPTRPSPS
ncbi:hypothetical protein ACX3P1_26205 [Mesorhizobium sp. A623]